MSVTGEHPTKVGQRVQEVFTDTRGWVVEFRERNDRNCAVVEWDDPVVDLGDDDRVFPLDALHVVEVIQLDWDHYIDPSKSPLVTVDDPHNDLRRARYTFPNGHVAKGISAARVELIKLSTRS